MSINAKTLCHPGLILSGKDKDARGKFTKIFTNTIESTQLFQRRCMARYKQRVLGGRDGVPLKDVPLHECSNARANPKELTDLWHVTLLFQHWALERATEHYGESVKDRALKAFMSGDLDTELLEISNVKAHGDCFDTLKLHSMPVFKRNLDGKTLAKSAAESLAETNQDTFKELDELEKSTLEEAAAIENYINDCHAYEGQTTWRKVLAATNAHERGKELVGGEAGDQLFKVWPAAGLSNVAQGITSFSNHITMMAAPAADAVQKVLPSVSIWHLNGLAASSCEDKSPVWSNVAEAVGNTIEKYSNSQVLVLMERTVNKTSRAFSSKVFEKIEDKGVDLQRSLAVNFERQSHNYKGNRTAPGRIGIMDNIDDSFSLGQCQILGNSVIEAQLGPSLWESPEAGPYAEIKDHGRHIASPSSRQYNSTDMWKRIISAACYNNGTTTDRQWPADSWQVNSRPFSGHSSSVEDLQWSPSEVTVFASCACSGVT